MPLHREPTTDRGRNPISRRRFRFLHAFPILYVSAMAPGCLESGTGTEWVRPDSGEILIPSSTDWTDRGTVFRSGEPGQWDHLLWGGFTVSAVKREGAYLLYYQGSDTFRTEYDPTVCHRSIGLAIADSALAFTKLEDNPVLTWAPNGECEEGAAAGAAMVTGEDDVILFFGANTIAGRTKVTADIRFARSSTGKTRFQDLGVVLHHEDPEVWGHGDELFPVLAFGGMDRWLLYYVPNGTLSTRRLGVGWGPAPERITETARVRDGLGRSIPVWGPASYGRVSDDKAALFLKNGPEAPIEVRLVELSSPEVVSDLLETYSFPEVRQAAVLLDVEAGVWLMFYRGEDYYGLKTAPIKRSATSSTAGVTEQPEL